MESLNAGPMPPPPLAPWQPAPFMLWVSCRPRLVVWAMMAIAVRLICRRSLPALLLGLGGAARAAPGFDSQRLALLPLDARHRVGREVRRLPRRHVVCGQVHVARHALQ